MTKRLYIVLPIVIISLILTSCNNKTEQIPVTEPEVPSDFVDFYTVFHTDSAYQMQHILFPLDGRPASADGQVYDEPYTWDKTSWKLHSFDHFDPDQYTVRRKVTDSTLVTEFIIDRASGYGIKRRFAKFSDEWYLIYYDAMNQGQ